MPGHLWTAAQVAQYLQVNIETVYNLIRNSDLPAAKIGGQWRFQKAEITHWIEEQMDSGAHRRHGMTTPETNNGWNGEERRGSERHSIHLDLRVTDLDQETVLGDVVDISLTGMRIVCDASFPVGATHRVRLDITLGDGDPEAICFETQIIRSQYLALGSYEMGCANTLSPSATAQINQLIENIKAIA